MENTSLNIYVQRKEHLHQNGKEGSSMIINPFQIHTSVHKSGTELTLSKTRFEDQTGTMEYKEWRMVESLVLGDQEAKNNHV